VIIITASINNMLVVQPYLIFSCRVCNIHSTRPTRACLTLQQHAKAVSSLFVCDDSIVSLQMVTAKWSHRRPAVIVQRTVGTYTTIPLQQRVHSLSLYVHQTLVLACACGNQQHNTCRTQYRLSCKLSSSNTGKAIIF
jgi:hypothetical protein